MLAASLLTGCGGAMQAMDARPAANSSSSGGLLSKKPEPPASSSSSSSSSSSNSSSSSRSSSSSSSSNSSSSSSSGAARPLGDAAAGSQVFGKLCVSCQDGAGQPFALGPFTSYQQLVTVIETTMPFVNAGTCTGTCAEDVATYILNTYNKP